MKETLSILICVLVGVLSESRALLAQELGSDPTPAAVTNQTPEAIVRDPFWPVGYVKPKPVQEEIKQIKKIEQTKESVVWPPIDVKGFIKTRSGWAAFLEQYGMVSPGEILKIKKNGWFYRLRIEDVSESEVVYRKMDATPPGEDSVPIIFSADDKIKQRKNKP